MSKKRIDLTGQKFGRWTVIDFNEEESAKLRGKKRCKTRYWNCKCECGTNRPVSENSLLKGKSFSCGCYNREKIKEMWCNDSYRNKMKEKASGQMKEYWSRDDFRQTMSTASSKRMKERWDDKEWKEKRSDEVKKQWEDEDFREKQSKRLKERWNDENLKEKQREKGREMLKEKWQDEDFKKMKSEQMREIAKEKWKDEEYRQMQSELSSKRLKEQWENEEFAQRQSELASRRLKEKWENEDYRCAMCDKAKERVGEKNPNYNPNLTDEDRQGRRILYGYDEWSKQIKIDANYTCDCCGKRGGSLISHHLDGYNWCRERRIDITNGVCLCEACHKEFHKLYGKGDNTKEQYIEFKEEKNKKCE